MANNTFYVIPKKSDLKHYGVLGMKWGIRRYQTKGGMNKGGSYTAEGLRRYQESKQKYESAKAKYAQNKTHSNAIKLQDSKLRLKKDYRQLERDYQGDKGRDLYSKGKTITDLRSSPSTKVAGLIAVGGLSAMTAALKYIPKDMPTIVNNSRLTWHGKQIPLKYVVTAMGVGALTVSSLIAANNKKKIRQLEAYYGHSREPRL